MIEWIRITPETKFPSCKGQLIFIDSKGNSSVWERSDGKLYGYDLNPHDCCTIKFEKHKNTFTHYAIINVPEELPLSRLKTG